MICFLSLIVSRLIRQNAGIGVRSTLQEILDDVLLALLQSVLGQGRENDSVRMVVHEDHGHASIVISSLTSLRITNLHVALHDVERSRQLLIRLRLRSHGDGDRGMRRLIVHVGRLHTDGEVILNRFIVLPCLIFIETCETSNIGFHFTCTSFYSY
nr:MAG TPA: hypothetical protein [Caudoviricetes sp.]